MNKGKALKATALVVCVGVSVWLMLPSGDGLSPEQRAARDRMISERNQNELQPGREQQASVQQQPQPQQQAPSRRNINVVAEDLANEIVIRSSNPDEALQHAELALSIRNQQLMTRRASMLADQRKAELEAFTSQTEFARIQERREIERRERQRLEVISGESFSINTGSPSAPPELTNRELMPLERIRLLGIFKDDSNNWVARISRPGAIERVRNGYVIDGSIDVSVYADRIRLTRNDESIELYL